jgi:GMP synthase (glutamine-hydrolysing)
MKLLVVDNAEPEDYEFNQPLKAFVAKNARYDFDFVNYTEMPKPEVLPLRYGAVVLSGAPLHYSFGTIEDRAECHQWILATELPVLGICLGHQLISRLFGGEIVSQEKEEYSIVATYAEEKDPLLENLPDPSRSFMMHRASATLPPEFKRLARTDLCANAIMRHPIRPISGVQAHPEYSPNGAVLLRNFISLAEAAMPPEIADFRTKTKLSV